MQGFLPSCPYGSGLHVPPLREAVFMCHPLPLKGLRSLNDKAVPVLQIPGVEKKQVDDDNVREKVTKVTRDTGKAVAAAGGRPSQNSGS